MQSYSPQVYCKRISWYHFLFESLILVLTTNCCFNQVQIVAAAPVPPPRATATKKHYLCSCTASTCTYTAHKSIVHTFPGTNLIYVLITCVLIRCRWWPRRPCPPRAQRPPRNATYVVTQPLHVVEQPLYVVIQPLHVFTRPTHLL